MDTDRINKIAKNIVIMPKVGNFFGIEITLGTRDEYPPPHFHARCRKKNASFNALTGKLMKDSKPLPPPKMRRVKQWFASGGGKEILENWEYDSSGNWRRKTPVVKRASFNLDLPCEGENNFFWAIRIVGIYGHNDFTLEIWFGDGSHKIFDMKPDIEKYEEFASLKNLESFLNFHFTSFGVDWNDEADIDAYGLYKRGKEVE